MWYLFLALLSSAQDESAANSLPAWAEAAAACRAPYSRENPASHSAWREATCGIQRCAGMAVRTGVEEEAESLDTEAEEDSMSQSGTMEGAGVAVPTLSSR